MEISALVFTIRKPHTRPVAYAALEEAAETDWDKDSSVVQKEDEEDTELAEKEAGIEK